MKSCTLELIVNILTYAIKNKDYAFSQKDFKNVVYTKEFQNFDLNEKIAEGFEYLLKRGLLQLKSENQTFYEKYRLPESIRINTHNYTNVFKELSKRIILMHEGLEMINDTYEVKDDYAQIIESIDISNSSILSHPDKEQIKTTLTKILLSLTQQTSSKYSLLTIIQLLELKSSIKIEMECENYKYCASNIKFNHIQFNDNTLVLYFDKCSFEIEELSHIKNIESMDNTNFDEQLKSSINILSQYPKEEIGVLSDFLSSYIK